MALMRQGPGAPEPSPAPEAVSGPTTEAGAGTAPVAAGSMQWVRTGHRTHQTTLSALQKTECKSFTCFLCHISHPLRKRWPQVSNKHTFNSEQSLTCNIRLLDNIFLNYRTRGGRKIIFFWFYCLCSMQCRSSSGLPTYPHPRSHPAGACNRCRQRWPWSYSAGCTFQWRRGTAL